MKSKRAEEHIGQNFDLGTYMVEVYIANEAVDIAEEDARERAVRAHAQTCSEYRSGVCYNDPTEIVDCKPEDCTACKEFLSHYDCDYEY